jgi:hypothetical protein
MNILKRLKKIENRVIKEVSAFCECELERNIRVPGDPPFPEKCETCGKPLLIKVITFNFNNDIKINEH